VPPSVGEIQPPSASTAPASPAEAAASPPGSSPLSPGRESLLRQVVPSAGSPHRACVSSSPHACSAAPRQLSQPGSSQPPQHDEMTAWRAGGGSGAGSAGVELDEEEHPPAPLQEVARRRSSERVAHRMTLASFPLDGGDRNAWSGRRARARPRDRQGPTQEESQPLTSRRGGPIILGSWGEASQRHAPGRMGGRQQGSGRSPSPSRSSPSSSGCCSRKSPSCPLRGSPPSCSGCA